MASSWWETVANFLCSISRFKDVDTMLSSNRPAGPPCCFWGSREKVSKLGTSSEQCSMDQYTSRSNETRPFLPTCWPPVFEILLPMSSTLSARSL